MRCQVGDPPGEPDEVLTDDTLEDKNPAFDENLVDSRPLGQWEVNASAAVIRLDCPPIKPDVEQSLLLFRRSYAEAIQQAPPDRHVLPSANLLDGAAKQFDDGLYAAVDLACYRGELGLSRAAPDLIQAAFTQLAPGSAARPFLAAALELAGRTVPLQPEEETGKQDLLARFEADQARSKPIGFYQWTPELKQVWRFYRFLQKEFRQDELDPCREVAAVLGADLKLCEDYRSVNGFYGHLTNPAIALPANALIGADADLKTLARRHGVRHATVSIFPPSTSRETELLDRLFPMGVPAGTNLMNTLIRRIRSGEIDLKPGTEDGWYECQVYALETMLLWALAMLTVAPAVVWANAGPPHRPGRLVGEPNGLESVAIKRERLSFDLRPLTSAGVTLVEAVYEIENTGEEQTVDLVFVSGSMASDSAAVVLDEQPVPVVWKKIDALPPGWQAPDTTPSLSGKGTLPYEANAALEIPYFLISLSPGLHQPRVRYSAKAASYSIGGSPRLYWQMAYILASGVEIPAK